MGILKRPPVREGCAQAPVPSVSHAARPMRVAQAPSAPGGHHRVADGDLRQHEPRIHRRSAVDRLDPGRMRTQPSRPSNARRLARPPVTGIAPRTPDFSGGFGCTESSPLTGLRVRWLSPRPTATSARSDSSCWGAVGGPEARCSSVTRAMPGGRSPVRSVSWTPRSCVPDAPTNPHTTRTWPRSVERIESIFTERQGHPDPRTPRARTLAGIRERILQRFLALATCIVLNHQLGRPSRALVDYLA